MAVIFTSLTAQIWQSMPIAASRALFGSCNHIPQDLLPKFWLETEIVDWHRSLPVGGCTLKANHLFFDTPSNPTLKIIDILTVSEVVPAAGRGFLVHDVLAVLTP